MRISAFWGLVTDGLESRTVHEPFVHGADDGVFAPHGACGVSPVVTDLPALGRGVEKQLFAPNASPSQRRVAHEFERHFVESFLGQGCICWGKAVGVATAVPSLQRPRDVHVGSRSPSRPCKKMLTAVFHFC